jgi:D-3-phosphoglycerate dehydrogenase / 2-oxoglutarate reductase
MFKIQTLNKISPVGLEQFPLDLYEVASEFTNPDAVLVRSADMHSREIPAGLKAVGRAGAGVNNIPVGACTQRGVVVFNTPGANANAVKELTLAALFIASRNLIEGASWVKDLDGISADELKEQVEKGKSNYTGPELLGKTLGVIGLGAIGRQVANAAESLGMRVIGFDPYISVDSAWEVSKSVEKAVSLDHLLSMSDYLSLHIPLTDRTRGYINKSKFQVMKSGIRILNFARGALITREDLIEALESGVVARYVTDFPDAGLLRHPRVIAFPHLGASTPESETNCAVMAVNQLRNYLENGNIRNSVNFPDTEMPRNNGYRLTIANRNIPGMVGQITALLAQENINIADLLNKHRDDTAYNIIDVDGVITEEQANRLAGIEGIIMVRVIPPASR